MNTVDIEPPKKFLIAAAGSHGDVLPCIAVGRELQARGHAVRLFASGTFAPLAAAAGLPFTEVLSAADHQRLLDDAGATDRRRGMALLAGAVIDALPRSLALLDAAFVPGRTVLVGTSLAWATRLLAEQRGAPVATLHLSPSWFRSAHRAPSLGPLGHLEGAPRLVKRALWALIDRRFLDPLFTVPLNRLRAGLGLAPVERAFHRWPHAADATLGLFPAWFAPPQPDWPASLQLTGFPLEDAGDGAPLPADVERFLDAGAPPVAFTAGTANATSHAFFAEAARACALSGRRGLLLTPHAAQLPAPLPPGVAHAAYVPFGALLPRLAAFVHHGGIGTTAQALAAGVPQLLRPMAFDQFDNARHVLRLGAGRQLLPRQWRAPAVARVLDGLLDDAPLRQRCAAVAQAMAAERPGAEAAADALEALAVRA